MQQARAAGSGRWSIIALVALAPSASSAQPTGTQPAGTQPVAEERSAATQSPAPAAEAPPADIVMPPRALSDTSVAYPEMATGNASVELELVIDRHGVVQAAQVRSGDPPFAEAAEQAALSWRFEPARRGEQPIAARIRFRVEFRQEQVEAQPPPELPVAPAPSGAPPPPPPIEVTVRGAAPAASRTVSRAFAQQLPGAFGNPFAALEAAPGVTPTLSGAPYFYVRGSPPGNLGYLLDDLRLPALFHVLAGPSVVHPALVDSVDFFPGPYPARYGRFAGGIAAGKLRRASHELQGELSVRAFDASGLVELPLAEHTSLTLAGRVSYANPIAHLFAPEIDVGYWDYQARLSHHLSARSELSAFAFGSHDALDREDDDGQRRVIFGADFHRLQLRYRRQLDAGWASVTAAGGWDRSALSDGDVRLTDTVALLRTDLEHELTGSWRLQAGADGGRDRYTLRLGPIDDPTEREDFARRYPARTDTVAGLYLGALWRGLPGLQLNLGGRFDVFHSRGQLALAPAASVIAELALSPALRLIHGLGIAHQPPSANVPQPGSNPALGAGLQHALQHSAGIALALPHDLALEATLFNVALFNLSDSISISRIDNGDDSLDEDSRSLGYSRGLELGLRRSLSQRLGGYLSYTLSTSRRSVGRAEGPALFDRSHVLSGALAYRWGSGWHTGLRGSFYSGVPADVAYLRAAQDPPRTSPYYRLDTRVEKRWALGDGRAYWALVLEVLNTTLQKEALNMSCSAYVCREEKVGPLTIPSLGLEAFF
jgi:TonB family protein